MSDFEAIRQDLKSLRERPESRRGPFVITDEELDAMTEQKKGNKDGQERAHTMVQGPGA